MDRREFVATGTAGVLVALAGCGSLLPWMGSESTPTRADDGSSPGAGSEATRTETEGGFPPGIEFVDFGGNETDTGLLVWFVLRNEGETREEMTVIAKVQAGSERRTQNASVTLGPGETTRREIRIEVDPDTYDQWSLEFEIAEPRLTANASDRT